jgi:hypothetical protein
MAHSARSDVLVDFASPFLPLGSLDWRHGPSASVQWILDLAGLVWDLTDAGLATPQILEAIGPLSAETAGIVDALVRRKTVVFARDRRLARGSA